MLNFGDDLARLAGEIIGGHEARSSLLSGIRVEIQEDRATGTAERAAMQTKWKARMAESTAARSADMRKRSAEVRAALSANLNERRAAVNRMRETNQAHIRDERAILRLDLDEARQHLAGTVQTLRETMRTVHAETSADLRNQLRGDFEKMRGHVQQQFALARAAWGGDGKVSSASVAPGPDQPARPAPPAGAPAMTNDSVAAAPVPASKPPVANSAPPAPVASPVTRNEWGMPPVHADEIATNKIVMG